MNKKFYGILAAISWNSNKWAGPATTEDIHNSNFEWVKQNHRMMEDLNFAHDKYPSEANGAFVGYTPMFNTPPSSDTSRYVEIVFFKSLNYHNKQNCIVGFYAFPEIGNVRRKADHDIYSHYVDGGMSGNIRSKPEHICMFGNPIQISDAIAAQNQLLPPGKKLGQQGFNYLFSENVFKILDMATSLNPGDKKLSSLKFKILRDIGSGSKF